ncbi:MAG: gliding motility-associated C-terminal domain-containing protein [Ferruginibacter sp.]
MKLTLCSIFPFLLFFIPFTGLSQTLNKNKTQPADFTCTNWLSTPATSVMSFAQVGDLDIPGTNLTVEVVFNRTTPYSSDAESGNLVSKHYDPGTVNYLIRPNSAYITTSTGFYSAVSPCEIELNKTYHIAMTYDGSSLKFYRDGYLLRQTPATGNLYQSNLRTRIGWYDGALTNEQFVGYINEVRIWNVARTQNEIRANMSGSLPSPTTQTGLLAYYTFDNLVNKQGNTAWNASLVGNAVINQTNTSCSFTPDSCGVVTAPADSIIINKYTPVILLDQCKNNINVANAAEFNVGDTVLLIQMKGAVIDSTNTAAFGNITDYKNAGNYEFNYVKSKTGNTIELLNRLTRQYDLPDGKVQLIRVPYYHNVTFSNTLTCAPWDGEKGGVLAFNVRDNLTLQANIDISSKGFRGGTPVSNPSPVCNVDSFYLMNADGAYGSQKGEGITNTLRLYGRGKLANGGGGGNSANSGGAGGSNGGSGGSGGKQYNHPAPVCNNDFTNGGIGGLALQYNNTQRKIFPGGGGGSGHVNESLSLPGGSGGGIAIISAGTLIANSYKIISNGGSPRNTATTSGPEDGKSGGGGGGAVLLNYTSLTGNLAVEAKGGDGDFSVISPPASSYHGPGGGGGGGVVWINAATFPTALTTNITGGANGTNIYMSNNAWGATAGASGQRLNSLVLPVDNVLFKPNIDSVRFTSSVTACKTFNFNGAGYTNTNPIASWQWSFGDGNTASTQNTSHTYTASGTYTVKLVATDVNGCKDSISLPVTATVINPFAGNDASYCSNTAITHQLTGTGAGSGETYSWQPSVYLDNPSIANPVATLSSTIKFYLTISNANGCSGIDSVIINVNPVPVLSTFGDTSVCTNATLNLNAGGATTYTWSPAAAVSNPNIANPVFTGNTNQTLTVTGSNGPGCTASSSFNVTVKPAPVVTSISDSTTCGPQAIVLTTTGAQTYSWSPATNLSNPAVSNPTFTGNSNTSYTVTGTAANGCTATDVVNITIAPVPVITTFPDTAVCSNAMLQLNASGAGTYTWSPASAVSNPNIANPVFTGTATQTLTVTGSNAPGCNASSSFIVTFKNAPVVSTLPDSTICSTQSIVLTTTGAQTYSWSPATNLSNPAIASPTFSGSTGNTYTVTGVAANGCSNTDMIVINVVPPPAFNQPPNAAVCINKTVTLNGNNGSNVQYQWSPATGLNNTAAANPIFTPSATGNTVYTLSVSENVCQSNAQFQVNIMVNPLPTVTATRSNDLDCNVRTSALTAGGAATYSWTPAASLNNPLIATPVASPQVTTTYTVTGTDDNGCANSTAVEVKVGTKEGGYYIPNTFTPNGDGLNDCFGVKQWGNVSEFYFIIYNRWGEKVFETRDINNCWDGRYKGNRAPVGNYVYYIRSKNVCSEQVKKGNVLLIR